MPCLCSEYHHVVSYDPLSKIEVNWTMDKSYILNILKINKQVFSKKLHLWRDEYKKLKNDDNVLVDNLEPEY
jgi:hypothetical protein